MNDILETICSCKITNIRLTTSEPVQLYTQYISPNEFYLVTYNSYSTERANDNFYVFMNDASNNEYIYSVSRSPSNVGIYKLKWESDLPLTYCLQIAYLESITCNVSDKHILFMPLPVLIKNYLFSDICNLLNTYRLFLLDEGTCNILEEGDNKHNKIAQKLEALILAGSDSYLYPAIHINSLLPLDNSNANIDELGCLVFDDTCRIDSDNIAITMNKWDAILVSTTHIEVEDGRLECFLKNLIRSLEELGIITDKHLYISTNKPVQIRPSLDALLSRCRPFFVSIRILNCNIPPADDVYIRDISRMCRPFPKYGNASGPNSLFLTGMRKMAHHNTVLHLETDCKLVGNWIVRCNAYIESCGKFLIAGALYDGKQIGNQALTTHLNGVAFYKTGAPLFHKLLNFLEVYIRRNAQFGRLESGYDYVLRTCVNKYLESYMDVPSYYCFWRYIHRMLVHTSLIVNMSILEDSDIPANHTEQLYSPAIIHQK
jgi:hypothetical protein